MRRLGHIRGVWGAGVKVANVHFQRLVTFKVAVFREKKKNRIGSRPWCCLPGLMDVEVKESALQRTSAVDSLFVWKHNVERERLVQFAVCLISESVVDRAACWCQ